MLATDRLCLSYNHTPIIEALNVEIPAGKITVLVGPNGSGKSTLLRGLARLLTPRSGVVYLQGKSLKTLSSQTIAKSLGILLQNPTAPEGLTVKELVKQGRYPHQNWLQPWSAEDEYWVHQALRVTHLIPLQDRALETLSGGQRQRA